MQGVRWRRVGMTICSLLITAAAATAAAGSGPPATGQLTAPAAPGEVVSLAGPARSAGPDRRELVQPAKPPVPPHSGSGRRVVFDMSSQRVWLVREDGGIRSTYLVSGSVTDNLEPARYAVYSRSRYATSFDLDSTMEYMVRFTEGDRAAIGFHDIPVDGAGVRLQLPSDLGTPQSHGCIRQRHADAEQMWRFAALGTPVVVTA